MRTSDDTAPDDPGEVADTHQTPPSGGPGDRPSGTRGTGLCLQGCGLAGIASLALSWFGTDADALTGIELITTHIDLAPGLLIASLGLVLVGSAVISAPRHSGTRVLGLCSTLLGATVAAITLTLVSRLAAFHHAIGPGVPLATLASLGAVVVGLVLALAPTRQSVNE